MYNTAIQYFQYSQSILYYSSSYWVWGGWAENWEETSIKRLQSFLKVPWPGPRPFNRALWFFPKSTQCHPRQKHSTLLSSHSSGPPAPKGRLSLPSWPAHLIPSEPGRCFLHNPLMTWGGGEDTAESLPGKGKWCLQQSAQTNFGVSWKDFLLA